MTETPGDFEIPEEAAYDAAVVIQDHFAVAGGHKCACGFRYDSADQHEIHRSTLALRAALPHLRVHQTATAEAWKQCVAEALAEKYTHPLDLMNRREDWTYPERPMSERVKDEVDASYRVGPDHDRSLVLKAPTCLEISDVLVAAGLLPTEAETKALAETATQLGRALGRQEAADEIAAKCLRRAQLADRVPEGERSGVREGMVVTWLAAETLARDITKGDGS